MQKKVMTWKTRGMNRDTSVSVFSNEFSYENKNLRLSTVEGNTNLSWVNERGTSNVSVNITDYDNSIIRNIEGTALGTAVLNHTLVIFTHNDSASSNKDNIYVIQRDPSVVDGILKGKRIFNGNLNFNLNYPLETLVSYESDIIQKVYWVDGLNQPRVINIASTQDKLNRWNTRNDDTSYFFDFVPTYKMNETVSIEQLSSSGGLFAPGVIQYCFAYFNKYGQQSNVVYASTLYYLTHTDRGASAEDKVATVFSINIEDLDSNFDYVRLYSIQRTSIDTTPIVKILDDIPIKLIDSKYKVSYIDTGTTGSFIDPTELLFIGGNEISALTIADKDNTLFLGNIKQRSVLVNSIQSYFNGKRGTNIISFNCDSYKSVPYDNSDNIYPYKFTLKDNYRNISTFKGGEIYRFGIQLQKKNGEWTNPIYINDATNDKYPIDNGTSTYLSYASGTISISEIATAYNNGKSSTEEDFYSAFKRIRPVIVHPSIADRKILCQGVLNPTVFNIEDRADNTPFAQASWFFRPYDIYSGRVITSDSPGAVLQFEHYKSIHSYFDACDSKDPDDLSSNYSFGSPKKFKRVEIQGSKDEYDTPYSTVKDEVKSNTQFFIDQSIVTLNSPDLEFDTEVQAFNSEGLKLRVIGMIPIESTASAHNVTTSSGMVATGEKIAEGVGSWIWNNVKQITGSGESSKNVTRIKDKWAIKRLVSGFLWNDSLMILNTEGSSTNTATDISTKDYILFPWQKIGSLNNDPRNSAEASSLLRTKVESNIWVGGNTQYFVSKAVNFEKVGVQIPLTENAEVMNYRLSAQNSNCSNINYYANIDKALVNSYGYKVVYYGKLPLSISSSETKAIHPCDNTCLSPISIKYKSTTHAVVALDTAISSSTGNPKIPILPYAVYNDGTTVGKYVAQNSEDGTYSTFWGKSGIEFSQSSINTSLNIENCYGFLWLGELYKDSLNPFGGTDEVALLSNNWIPAGESKNISSDNSSIELKWTEGDTFYQRYDCLKTYPFTNDDTNQIVEILSFMCESRVNIDGRYDRNRGQINNLNVRPTNFNLLNPVYTQKNNFFSYKKTNTSNLKELNYPNQVYYTKTKQSGADVDLWTNVTLASMLELDGDKGQITSIERLNDQLVTFQDTGISQLLYNENMQITTQEGVPIELANSGKVQGKRYISDTIGCSNKWSIVTTPIGIYFMDSNDKSIYLYNGQLANISLTQGFNSWAKQNIPSANNIWNPNTFNSFIAHYDKKNQDILFINKDTALAYSEKFGCFTSFYDYGNTSYLCSFDDYNIWVKSNGSSTKLYSHQKGNYNNFFGTVKPYSITLVGNPEPQTDKVFTNLDFRTVSIKDGTSTTEGDFNFNLPFDTLETWNDYQHGILNLKDSKGTEKVIHYNSSEGALIRKFRMWRCDIPRDNAPLTDDVSKGITRNKVSPMNRMRNPWLYLKLTKTPTASDNTKVEIQDIAMAFFS